jgi:hypothetical protein
MLNKKYKIINIIIKNNDIEDSARVCGFLSIFTIHWIDRLNKNKTYVE